MALCCFSRERVSRVVRHSVNVDGMYDYMAQPQIPVPVRIERSPIYPAKAALSKTQKPCMQLFAA